MAEFFYNSVKEKYPDAHPRTIARLVATMAEGDTELTKLLKSNGVDLRSPLAKELRFLLGMLAVENGSES